MLRTSLDLPLRMVGGLISLRLVRGTNFEHNKPMWPTFTFANQEPHQFHIFPSGRRTVWYFYNDRYANDRYANDSAQSGPDECPIRGCHLHGPSIGVGNEFKTALRTAHSIINALLRPYLQCRLTGTCFA